MILKCTDLAVGLLAGPRAEVPRPSETEDDWYANLLWIERRKCVLLMHVGTLFATFVADVRTAAWRLLGPRWWPSSSRRLLAREQLAAGMSGVLDPAAVVLAATASRRVLGYMNETADACRHGVALAGGLEQVDVDELDGRLCRMPHNRDGYQTALELVAPALRRGKRTGHPVPGSAWHKPHSRARRQHPGCGADETTRAMLVK